VAAAVGGEVAVNGEHARGAAIDQRALQLQRRAGAGAVAKPGDHNGAAAAGAKILKLIVAQRQRGGVAADQDFAVIGEVAEGREVLDSVAAAVGGEVAVNGEHARGAAIDQRALQLKRRAGAGASAKPVDHNGAAAAGAKILKLIVAQRQRGGVAADQDFAVIGEVAEGREVLDSVAAAVGGEVAVNGEHARGAAIDQRALQL